MKIIKYSIVVMLGAYLLPAPPQNELGFTQTNQVINLETGQVISAAASTWADISGFCGRQPGTCQTAGQIFSKMEAKVKYSFQKIYEWSGSTKQNGPGKRIIRIQKPHETTIRQNQLRGEQAAADHSIMTGSVPIVLAGNQPKSTNTLQIEDLLPDWRGPVATG